MVGMKPAGGISNSKLALHYLIMVKEVLGDAWLTNQWFRFGASSLANDVLNKLVKLRTGRYQSNDYFSKRLKIAMKTKDKSGSGWDLSPAPENTDQIKLKKRYDHFINGKFVKPEEGKYFTTSNPATHEKLAEIAEGSAKDVDKAVSAARKAYENVWSVMPAQERAKYIYRIARMIQERAKEFAIIESMDGGKPIRESRDIDIPLAANTSFTMPDGPTSWNMLFQI